MLRRKHVELLLHKAAQDESSLDILLQHEAAPAEAVGFHAQQAAEKLLKAAIKAAGAEYPLTHRLAHLLDQAREAGAHIPLDLEDVRHLTPYATRFRYDALPDDGTIALDTGKVRQLIRDLRAWVEAFVATRDWGEEAP